MNRERELLKLGIKIVLKGFAVFQDTLPISPGNSQEFLLRCKEKQRHPLAGLMLNSGKYREPAVLGCPR